jgi:hypothetical protein
MGANTSKTAVEYPKSDLQGRTHCRTHCNAAMASVNFMGMAVGDITNCTPTSTAMIRIWNQNITDISLAALLRMI